MAIEWKGKKELRYVVACQSCSGPTFYPCKVKLTFDEYQNGDGYDEAEGMASEDDYDGPMVAFDENDGPGWLFDRFDWAKAATAAGPEAP